MYGITFVGIVFLCLLGTLAFFQGNIALGSFDFLAALLLAGILFLLRLKGHLNLCIYTGITVMYCLYLYLFISGGVAGNAYLWSYTFPLFTFSLLGPKKGFIVSFFYFLSCLTVQIVDLSTPTLNIYDKNLAIRFSLSFLVVIIFSFFYEKSRKNSQSALEKSRHTLEQKVIERTRELQDEIERRKEKEHDLRLSESRYRTLYDNSSDGLSIISLDGRYLSANQEFCRRLGYSENELKALGPADIYHENPAHPIKDMLKKVISSGSAQFEAEQVCKSGEHLHVEVRSSRINFDNQTAVLCSCRDISERKKQEEEKKNLERQLFRASKMEAIGLMAGGVAHDLNNILSGIVSYPELLLLELPESSELRKPLETIHEAGKRAAKVVADLLTVARGAASTREPHNINSLIQEYLDSPEHRKLSSLNPHVVFDQQFDASQPTIICSPVHITKTLMNLVTNAAEAVGAQGEIVISTTNRSVDVNEATSKNVEPGNYVVLSVQDTGAGIADKDLEHIFEPFYTRKKMGRSGTGLGLAIVWNTVQDHNGKIFVESSAKGTCFHLYFPASNKEAGLSKKNETEHLAGNMEHILVVDDEPQLLDIASRILEGLGYIVHAVSSGEEAISYIKANPVDLVLLDMVMRPGINGHQTYQEIIKQYPGQKAIIVSGFSESEDVRATLELGAKGLVNKPYSRASLSRAVKEALTN